MLRGFAQRIEAELRGADVMARWGGEGSCCCCPAPRPSRRCRRSSACASLRQQPFDQVEPGLRITFSAGVGSCLGQGDIDSAIERADRTLYRAKGRRARPLRAGLIHFGHSAHRRSGCFGAAGAVLGAVTPAQK